jgi:L-fuculose-phosphate aldolase
LDNEDILITASGTSLGDLGEDDIVKVNLATQKADGDSRPSSELPLHSLIYKNLPPKTVIHCHPPLINGYFAVESSLKTLTFEGKLYLGDVPVIGQDTPTVTRPEAVIAALKTNNLAVLKNHGVVAVADKFEEGLNLIETLEETVKTAAVARLFKKEGLDALDIALKENLGADTAAYEMFSPGHIQAIVDLVNRDELVAQKGKELDLTVKLAIKLEGSDRGYKFNFEKGRIIKVESDLNAPFVISAPPKVWQEVFLGRLDSFVAVTQGKMKLKGQLAQLSRWYVPFSRIFALFKAIKIK